MVEGCFALFSHSQLQRGTFKSMDELKTAVQAYNDQINANLKSFTWTKSADTILLKQTVWKLGRQRPPSRAQAPVAGSYSTLTNLRSRILAAMGQAKTRRRPSGSRWAAQARIAGRRRYAPKDGARPSAWAVVLHRASPARLRRRCWTWAGRCSLRAPGNCEPPPGQPSQWSAGCVAARQELGLFEVTAAGASIQGETVPIAVTERQDRSPLVASAAELARV